MPHPRINRPGKRQRLLKPEGLPAPRKCPWCGLKPDLFGLLEGWHVGCFSAICSVRPKTREYPTKEEALFWWNATPTRFRKLIYKPKGIGRRRHWRKKVPAIVRFKDK